MFGSEKKGKKQLLRIFLVLFLYDLVRGAGFDPANPFGTGFLLGLFSAQGFDFLADLKSGAVGQAWQPPQPKD